MKKIKNLIKIGIVSIAASPLMASAQATVPPAPQGLRDVSNGQGIPGILQFIINLILGFAALTAILFLIIGGYQYIVSGANEELAEQGKKTIQNAIIGIVLIIISYTIVTVIFRALTGSY